MTEEQKDTEDGQGQADSLHVLPKHRQLHLHNTQHSLNQKKKKKCKWKKEPCSNILTQRQLTHTLPVLALSASVSLAASADLVFFEAATSLGSVFCGVLPVPAVLREFRLCLRDTEIEQASK